MKLVITCLIVFCSCSHAVSAKPPNILIFLADDLGWADLGFQGHLIFAHPTSIDSLHAVFNLLMDT